ncbi:hypothetical protein Bca101_076791 [Brassica carinata]
MEVVTEMVENHLMVVEVMVTEIELTKVITQGKDVYGGVAKGGGGFMVAIEEVAAEKLMKMVMEVVVTPFFIFHSTSNSVHITTSLDHT